MRVELSYDVRGQSNWVSQELERERKRTVQPSLCHWLSALARFLKRSKSYSTGLNQPPSGNEALSIWQSRDNLVFPHRTMASVLAATSLVLLSFFISISADTPANCTYEEITGTWVFSIGEGGHDNTINCSGFKAVTELHVTLLFPDVAVDSDGNVGFWTLIYNQGFEVNINGVVYFAFSAFEKSGGKVISMCDKTLNGWSHDAKGYHAGNWACYSGEIL